MRRAVWAILRAELRTLHRSVVMRVYAVLAIGGVCATLLVTSYWHGVMSGLSRVMVQLAPPHLLSWFGAPILWAALAVVVAFAAAASGRDRDPAFAALLARPFSTAALQTGRILAQVIACWWPLAAALAVVQCAGAVGSALDAPWGGTLRADALAAFLLLDAPAALAVFAAATTLFAVATRSRAVAAMCGLALVAAHAWAVFATPSHLLPAISLTHNFGQLSSDLFGNISAQTFLHRTGLALAAAGLVALGVCWHVRPAAGRPRALALGAALLVAGLAVPVAIAGVATDRLALRDAWRRAHVEALEQPAADAAIVRVAGRVRLAPGHGVEIDVTLELRLAPGSRGPLRFSFNPGMTVRDLRLDDKAAAYTHESGLLTVDLTTSDAAGVSMRLSAAGTPVSDFAYLDSPVEWRTLPAGHPLLWLGRDAVIDEKGLVALMPAARWLPALGVNVGARQRDIFLLDLTVEAPRGWLVAGPGRRQPRGEHVRFAPSAPVAHFGLVAGPYEQHAITVAGTRIELLAAPGHFDRIEGLVAAETLEARLGEIFERLAKFSLEYPYQGLTVVEVPMRLRTYGDGWRMAGLALPGLLLLREAHLATPAFQQGPPDMPPEQRLRWQEFYCAPGADLYGVHPLVALARQTFGLQTAADGPGALAIGFVLNDLAAQLAAPSPVGDRFSGLVFANNAGVQSRILRTGIRATWGAEDGVVGRIGDFVAAWATLPLANTLARAPTEEREDEVTWDAARVALGALDACAVAHLRQRAGQGGGEVPGAEAASDNGLCGPVGDAGRIPAALRLKGGAAMAELLRVLGTERAAALLATLRRRHAGGTFRASDVADADAGGEAGYLLDYWLNTSGLPGYVASPAAIARLQDDDDGAPRYQTRVHVFNAEPVDGSLHLSVGGPPPPDRADGPVFRDVTGTFVYDDSRVVRVAGNTAAEIGLVTRFSPERVRVVPGLSRNRGDVAVTLPPWATDIVHAAPFVGDRPSDWRPATVAGIVVDDLDAGFAVAPMSDAAHGALAPAWWLPRYSLLDTPRWSRKQWATAWGKYRRTVARTLAGEGRNAAVFAAQLPAQGPLAARLPLAGVAQGRHQGGPTRRPLLRHRAAEVLRRTGPLRHPRHHRCRHYGGGVQRRPSQRRLEHPRRLRPARR